jgi:hypothetical protein
MVIQFEPNEPAQVIVLGATGTQGPSPARVLAFSGKRMTIAASVAASPGCALKVESSGHIFMGEVIDVRQNGTILIHIHHALKRANVELLQSRWM